MDGGVDESVVDETDSDDLDPVPADAGKDPMDDSTGADDPVDLDDVDALDDDPLAPGEDREHANDLDEDAEFLVDRGSDPALESESMLADNDGLGVGDEDFGIGDDEPVGPADGGEEGPGEADDELREEDLPALDADDLGDGDESDFFDGEPAVLPPFPWEEPRWEIRTVASVGAVIAVVPTREGAVAIGIDPAQVWRIADERAEISLVAGDPREGWRWLRGDQKTGELWLGADAGAFVSRDGGRRFELLDLLPQENATNPIAAKCPSLAEITSNLASRAVELESYQVTAAAVLDEAGSLLAALRRAGDGATWLVRIPAAGSLLRTVALVRSEVSDVAWDEASVRAWVASDDGVTILLPPSSLKPKVDVAYK